MANGTVADKHRSQLMVCWVPSGLYSLHKVLAQFRIERIEKDSRSGHRGLAGYPGIICTDITVKVIQRALFTAAHSIVAALGTECVGDRVGGNDL